MPGVVESGPSGSNHTVVDLNVAGEEREVVELLYFHGLTQTEAAAYLDASERTIRRRWTVAKVKLFEGLKYLLPPG
jgi:predicted DNA-binding protein (UPF0251 family)